MGGFKGNQPCPRSAAFGHQDGFAGMGGINQAREMGFGFVHIDCSHRYST
jgi:hypothetical protein